MALQDKKIMPPPWLAHREIERYSIGWRMGSGEDYIGGADGIPHPLSRTGDLDGLVG